MLMCLWYFLTFLVLFEMVETFNVNFGGYSPSTMRSALEKNGEEIVTQVLDQVKLCSHQVLALSYFKIFAPSPLQNCVNMNFTAV